MKYNNIYDINTDDWYDSAVDLKAKGMSNRGIARTLFLNENYRNRLNDFFKNDHVLEDVYKREQELETLENGIQGHSISEVYVDEAEHVAKAPNPVKILYFDIETTLAKSYHWGQWQQNLSVKQQIQESHMLSHAWAWGDGEVYSSVLTPESCFNSR